MKSKQKSKSRYLTLLLVVIIPMLVSFSLLSSHASGFNAVPQQLSLSTTTTYVQTTTTTLSTTETTTSTSTSTTTSSTSTTTSSTSSSFSYTTTVSSTTTSTSTYTSYTNTVATFATTTSTSTTPTTEVAVTTSVATTSVLPSISCPVAQATSGTALEPYANFLRGFRNNQIQNTTAGRVFMQTFNGWYYSWAPSVSYAAAANPWFLDALRVGVYPLIGILYASYFSYAAISPFNAEAGALAAGIVAASLLGLVYVAPLAYVSSRLIRPRSQPFRLQKVHLFPASGWVATSAFMVGGAYLSGSALFMGLATASLTLSMLSVGSILGALGLSYVQLPFANLHAMSFTIRRLIPSLR